MNLSPNRQEVFCHYKDENNKEHGWISIRAKTYIEGENILCLKDDAHLGYIWDLPEMFGNVNKIKEVRDA